MTKRTILGLCLLAAASSQPVAAQQPGWAFTAGAGVGSENVYPGAEEFFVTPLPSVSATYNRGNASFSISILEGLGVDYVIPKWGLIASANVNAGPRRDSAGYNIAGITVEHSPATRALLLGSTPVEASLIYTASLHRVTPIGLLGVAVKAHPTSIRTEEEERTRTGLTYSLQYLAGKPVSDRLSVSGLLSLEFMNGTFADTWHSRPQTRTSAEVFQAEAGLRGAQVAMEVEYWLSSRVSMSVLGGTTVLMGDAKSSPFTVDRTQRVMRTQVLYHF